MGGWVCLTDLLKAVSSWVASSLESISISSWVVSSLDSVSSFSPPEGIALVSPVWSPSTYSWFISSGNIKLFGGNCIGWPCAFPCSFVW